MAPGLLWVENLKACRLAQQGAHTPETIWDSQAHRFEVETVYVVESYIITFTILGRVYLKFVKMEYFLKSTFLIVYLSQLIFVF